MLQSRSKWSKGKSGVSQGSVLGPLLFLIHLKHIDECVVYRVLEFAEDTKLIGAVANKDDMNMM
jgi:ribonuclease P/MRP protein subunit RPP40